jgi:hypothetical protein
MCYDIFRQVQEHALVGAGRVYRQKGFETRGKWEGG